MAGSKCRTQSALVEDVEGAAKGTHLARFDDSLARKTARLIG